MGASDGPVVAQVWRYPVKSLGGEQVGVSWAGERGLAGDRVWAVQDGDGKLGSGKSTRRFKRIADRGGHPLCLAIGGQIIRAGMIRTGDPVQVTAER